MICRWIASLLLVFAGCDRTPAPPPPAPPPVIVEVRPITPLLPRLVTHLAVDSLGNLYWNQESDPPVPGGDLTFVMGDGGVPQPIAPLNVDRVLAVLGATGGSGAIRSFAVGPGDALYALFVGSKGPTLLYAVLRYGAVDHRVTVVSDTSRVMAASGLGASLAVARGTLLGTRDNLWLWLRHSDGVALLKLTPAADGLGVRRVECSRAQGAADVRLLSDSEDLSIGDAGSLCYVDRPRAICWRIAPDGRMSQMMSLVGVSTALTLPAAHDQSLYFLSGAAAKFGTVDAASAKLLAPLARPETNEPTLFEYRPADGSVKTWDSTTMDAPANLPLQSVQARQLLWDDATGTLITFDAASGEILRLKFTRR